LALIEDTVFLISYLFPGEDSLDVMRRSKVLAKLRSGGIARICNFGHYLPYFPQTAAKNGYDGLWMDGEHRSWNPREVQSMLAFHHLADVDCFFRPPTLEKTGLYRILEDGAAGLIIPHVSTVEKAKSIVDAVKFPPMGDRGADGVGLDVNFTAGLPNYIEDSNRENAIAVQIETPQAVENVEEIAAVEGVDILFLGPGDLALRYGCKPSPSDPKLLEAIKLVSAAAQKHGKVWGMPVMTEKDMRIILDNGCRFMIHGSEFRMINNGLSAASAVMDKIFSEYES
jgi:4-hydroxy-2-oxoheptanedioate aldolase